MQAIWVSMTGNVKCVCKHSVEVLNPQDGLKRGRRSTKDASIGGRSEHKNRAGPKRRSSEHREVGTHFIELSKGDMSRNIVEMIYQAAARKELEKPMPVISKVFKVEKSAEMHRRFEKHREMIKKKEFEKKGHQRQNPRVMVDGNELIQFYTTFMSCNGENGILCNESSCGVCKIIQTGFEAEKNGIVRSVGSREAKGGANVNGNGRRSVIVCRTIEGAMGYMNEKIEGCDLVRSAVGSKFDYLIGKNPKAFLPCFVIVFEE